MEMRHSRFKSIFTLLVACFLSTVWQTSSEAQPWKHLKPDLHPQPSKDKLKLKVPLEPKSYPSDPIESDFDFDLLKRKLGNDYVPKYSALTKEEVLKKKSNDTIPDEQDFLRKMLVKSMPEEIKNLDFRMPGMKRFLGPKASKKLQLWLWQVSHCSVLQKWKDLGVRYWPRHINVGKCSKKATCSFPSGMKCRASGTKSVGVLRWHCLDRYAQRKDTNCMWLKFVYPVITDCKCSCLQ
ncbi:hypothetical protein ACROYT_G039079 [Oculina patagonica]